MRVGNRARNPVTNDTNGSTSGYYATSPVFTLAGELGY